MLPMGDCAVLVQVGDNIDEVTHTKVRLLADYLDRHPFEGMVEYVPAFTTVTVYYDSLRLYRSYLQETADGDRIAAAAAAPASRLNAGGGGIEAEEEAYPYHVAVERLKRILRDIAVTGVSPPRMVEIPVCYGGEFGPDLEEVAERNGLSVEDVIEIHTSGEYLVYMVGFAPGFPYLGGMSSRIAAPRRSTPRLAIPAGTVGIAGEQTGVYPIETPGGWQLIGRSPLALFLPEQSPPTLLEAGNVVRFYPITRAEYERWEGRGL